MLSPAQGSEREPTKGRVLAALDRFSKAPMTKDDLFVFYFAGHGIDQAGEAFLLTQDTPLDRRLVKLRDCAVSFASLQDSLGLIGAGRQLIMLDACRNDPTQGTRSLDADDDGVVVTRDIVLTDTPSSAPVEVPVQRAWISACQQGQKSHEHAKSGNSWFCHSLLNVLDQTPDGVMSVGSMVDRISGWMQQNAWSELAQASEQRPQLIEEGPTFTVRLGQNESSQTSASQVAVTPAVSPQPITPEPIELNLTRHTLAMPSPQTVSVLPNQSSATSTWLTPLDEACLELEGKLLGIEKMLAEVRSHQHEQLLDAHNLMEQQRQAVAQARQHADSKRLGLTTEQQDKLRALAATTQTIKPSDAGKIAPNRNRYELLTSLQAERKLIEHQRAYEACQQEYQNYQQQLIDQLESMHEQTLSDLLDKQNQDFAALMTQLFEQSDDPFAQLMDSQQELKQRRYRWTNEQTLSKAEQLFNHWQNENAEVSATSTVASDEKPGNDIWDNINSDNILEVMSTHQDRLPSDGKRLGQIAQTIVQLAPKLDTDNQEAWANYLSKSLVVADHCKTIDPINQFSQYLSADYYQAINRALLSEIGKSTTLSYLNDLGIKKLAPVSYTNQSLAISIQQTHVLGQNLAQLSPCPNLAQSSLGKDFIYLTDSATSDKKPRLGYITLDNQGNLQTFFSKPLHDKPIACDIDPNSCEVLVSYQRKTSQLMQSDQESQSQVDLDTLPSSMTDIRFTKDSRHPCVYFARRNEVACLDWPTDPTSPDVIDQFRSQAETIIHHAGTVLKLAVPSFSNAIASAGRDAMVRYYPGRDTNAAGWPTPFHFRARVTDLAFSPMGLQLVVVGKKTQPMLLHAQTGEPYCECDDADSLLDTVCFSPACDLFAAVSDRRNLQFWNAANGKRLSIFAKLPAQATNMCFTPDGQRIGVTLKDGTFCLVNLFEEFAS